MAITAEDVQRVAKKYVPYDNVQIIAVGDGSKIRDLLKKFVRWSRSNRIRTKTHRLKTVLLNLSFFARLVGQDDRFLSSVIFRRHDEKNDRPPHQNYLQIYVCVCGNYN